MPTNRNSSKGIHWSWWALIVVVAMAVGCTATPAQHSYVTDYEVVGDRTVKYIYLPGDRSAAGSAYLDQGVAVEICSLEQVEVVTDDEGDGDEEEVGEEDVADNPEDVEGEYPEAEEEQEVIVEMVETDCRQTRMLKTEEFR